MYDEIRIRFHRAADFRAGCPIHVCSSIPDSRSSPRAIFPGKSLTAAPVKLAPAQRKAIEQTSGVRVLHDEQRVWRVSGGGWFIVDEVVGKHEFITYAVGLNANGSLKQIEVMDYRETYGGEIRNENWRAQFVGKNESVAIETG